MVWSLRYLFSAICHVARIVNFKTSLYTIYYLVDIFSKELFKKILHSCCIYMSKLIKIRMWVSERGKKPQSFVLSFMEISSNVLLKLLSSISFSVSKRQISSVSQRLNFLPQFPRFNLNFKKLSFSNMHIEKHCKIRANVLQCLQLIGKLKELHITITNIYLWKLWLITGIAIW